MAQTSIKEYIGARYIPVFYDDGTGSANWKQTDTYEPLTIVLYQGNSYTSRQYVPANISISDTRYWLQTGNWNSQIEAYRQEVQAFDERIDDNADAISAEQTARANADTALSGRITTNANAISGLDTRLDTAESDIDALHTEVQVLSTETAVLIGDSWGTGSTGGGAMVDGWPETFKPSFPQIATWRERHTGGAGFVHKAASTNKNFVDMLEDIIDPLTTVQKQNVKFVLVAGGVNDSGYPTSDVAAGVYEFCRIAKQAFPNAKTYIAGINLMAPGGTRPYLFSLMKAQIENAAFGASYIQGSELAALQSTPTADGLHLTNYGKVGRILAQGVITGSCSQVCNDSDISFVLASGLTRAAGSLSFAAQTVNGVTQITTAGFSIDPDAAITIGSTQATTLNLGYIEESALAYNIFKNSASLLNNNISLFGAYIADGVKHLAAFELVKRWDNENRRCNLSLRNLSGTVQNVTNIFVAPQSPNAQATYLM